jgi:tricorn protease
MPLPRSSHVFCRALLLSCLAASTSYAQQHEENDTRLLRQPTLSSEHVAFTHGGDLWIASRAGGEARRLTSTPAVESNPHFSPDGQFVAFSSNRSGNQQVYVLPVNGGTPRRLTWYPADSYVRGWVPDGGHVLFASSRETAPSSYLRLWTVSPDGGPADLLPPHWGFDGTYSADGTKMVIDQMTRWDTEWRHYRGGQNTPLVLLDLESLDETLLLQTERSTDIQPIWLGERIYFLSDRDWNMNIWSYDPESEALEQVTDFDDIDVKWLAGHDGTLVYERDGWLHTFDLASGMSTKLEIHVRGDFPWAEARWEDVSDEIESAGLSPTGKRALFQARGEIFTVPVEKGTPRNMTRSSGAADRAPTWSPTGNEIAWFSDDGDGSQLLVATQDGLAEPRRLDIGESKMAWESTWSPDGTRIAFVDDDVRVRIVEVESGKIITVDIGGTNIERGEMGLAWSPDSKWLVYAKTYANQLRRIVVWSLTSGEVVELTGPMADSKSPGWSPDGKYIYFLASTDIALGSGWANTSSMLSDSRYGVYALIVNADGESPFGPQSDEEEEVEKGQPKDENGEEDEEEAEEVVVSIDPAALDRRTIALPMPVARYSVALAGPAGSLFVGERVEVADGERTLTIHQFSFEDREANVFVEGVNSPVISSDGSKLLYQRGKKWIVSSTDSPPESDDGELTFALRMLLDRREEWRQMFDESWHYMRDFFYDPNMHGRDWTEVRERYRPLVPWINHRSDLNYVMDMVNGELSVGHSFVFGGDMPSVESPSGGLLGADLKVDDGRWRIDRIYTFESWNADLKAPLDRPGLKVVAGNYLLGVDGEELTAEDDPYRLLDGTAGRQTVLHINDKPTMTNAWNVTVEPVSSEASLRLRAWVEDNRRRVDELSGGKLAYVWVPNTSSRGIVSFDRYYFAQQDKLGAVIDERYNGGGFLDDYMVDLMTRRLRAAVTNEVPDGKPFRLPAGILGPKVLLINERAGSGGDFFPWVFRQQEAGPLIGQRTWGGLVKNSVHYALIDGGALTAPDNAVFDPIAGRYIAENEGVPPDIEVRMDTKSTSAGGDPQLERGVSEVLRLLEQQPPLEVTKPPFPRPAMKRR